MARARGLSAWQQCRLNAHAVTWAASDKVARVHAVGAKSVPVAAKLAALLAQTA
jgi:hypothetical protein